MAPNPHKLLRDAIKTRRFDGAYYIYGDDEFQKKDAEQQLTEAAVDQAMRDFNLEIRQGGDITAELLDALVCTPPMMADRRVVVVRDVAAMKKDVRKRLNQYLDNPAHDTTVILMAPAGGKSDKTLEKLATPLQFNALSDDRVPKWIAHRASSALAVPITADAADLLHRAVGNDLHLLDAELEKLASYTNGAEITESAVSDIVGVARGETLVDLFDAVLTRDVSTAMSLIPHILRQPKMSAVYIVMGLSAQMLALAWGRGRVDAGVPLGRLESEYFGLLKSTGMFPMRPWGAAAKAWARAVPQWDAAACDQVIDILCSTDIALKESRVSSEEQVLANGIVGICAAGHTTDRRRRAA